MNLEKLTPAPWVCWYPTTPTGSPLVHVQDSNGKVHFQAELTDINVVAGEFLSIARAAFDVMLKRKWAPKLTIDCATMLMVWTVDAWNDSNPDREDMLAGVSRNFHYWLESKKWPDPFTALVEAEKRYVANCEGARQ